MIAREWLIAFSTTSENRFAMKMPGQFKHCMCFARIDEHWVFVEYARRPGGAIAVVPDSEADPWLAEAQDGATVLKVKQGYEVPPWPLLWCVPLTAYIVGIGSSALRPDAFFRDCVANGAELVCENH
jgi:hypothetical protein